MRVDADGRDGSRGAAAGAASAVSAAEVEVEVEVEAPLRLLVVGDSLAAGVGTAESCVPVLPGAIAEALGRELVEMELELLRPEPEEDRMRPGTGTERTVRWTAVGEAGASAGWVARTLGLGGGDGRGGCRGLAGGGGPGVGGGGGVRAGRRRRRGRRTWEPTRSTTSRWS